MPWVDESAWTTSKALRALDTRDTLRSRWRGRRPGARTPSRRAEAGVERLAGGERPRSVLVAALGGSGAGLPTSSSCSPSRARPCRCTTRRNVPLPGWVGPLDLVIAVSQSGRAAGPLALAAEAARRGASLLTVGAAGSPLAERQRPGARRAHRRARLARRRRGPPCGRMLTPVLLAATPWAVDAGPEVLARVADGLDELAEVSGRGPSRSSTRPRSLALELAEGVPVVLGDGPLAGVAARRAARMLARTARLPATWGELPDAASQVVACFDGPYTAAGRRRGPAPPGRTVDDIFADPFLDGPPAPRLRLLMLRTTAAEGGRPPTRSRSPTPWSQTAREAGVRVSEQRHGAGAPARAAGRTRRARPTSRRPTSRSAWAWTPACLPHVADLRDRTG